MKTRRSDKYELGGKTRLRLKNASVGRVVRLQGEECVTVLESPNCERACYYCVFLPEFSRMDTDRCPYYDLCCGRYRPDGKSVYFRHYKEK